MLDVVLFCVCFFSLERRLTRCILPFNLQYNDSLLLRPPSLSFRNNSQGFLLLGNLYSDVVFGHLRATSYGEKEWMEMKETDFFMMLMVHKRVLKLVKSL